MKLNPPATTARITTTLTSAGGDDTFFAKYDALGNLTWLKSAGGPGEDRAWDATVDGAGNVIGTGEFSLTASFVGSALTSKGREDIFLFRAGPGGP